ncbi:Leucine-rich repeat serine/threonine-protein kinase 2, partial [Entophlyctis luteolus]
MDILHQALQLAASTPIPYLKDIVSLGLAIWKACDQRRANNAALHALRDKVALVVVTLERKCQTEGTTVAASEHLPQLRYWLEEVCEWIAKQAAKSALVQVAKANAVRDKAALYADKLAFYIQVFQLAAVPWSGQGADKDLQPVVEQVLQVATADIVASIDKDLDGMRAELTVVMEQNARETVDAVLRRLDIFKSNMVDSIGLLDCLLGDAVARMGNMDHNIKKIIQTLERRSGFTVSGGSTQRVWSAIREDDLSHWSAEPIGSGSFGVVHLAQWGTAKVAVKRVDSVLHNPKVRADIASEVATWSRLNHPNVVRLFGACMDTDRPFIVMKYFHLGSLASHLELHSSIPRSQRVKWILEVCLGLSHIHQQRIIHGDLKSDNVLLDDANGEIVAQITDFGLSAFKSFGSKGKTTTDSKSFTEAFRWRAPESYKHGYRRDFPLDVFAFGMTSYEIFSGQLPYHFEHDRDTVRDWIREGEMPWEPNEKVHAGDCNSFLFVSNDVECSQALPADDSLWDIIAKCIRTDVKQRASLAEVQTQLEIEHARALVPLPLTPSWTPEHGTPSCTSILTPRELSSNGQGTLSPSSSISMPLLGSQFLLIELGELSTPALKFWQTWCPDDSKMTWDNFLHGLYFELGRKKIDAELLKEHLEGPAGGSQGPTLPACKTFVQANSVEGFPGMFQFAVVEDAHAIARKSSQDAYSQAQHYEDGSGGFAQNSANAVKFYQAAADEGLPLAQAKMAGIYFHGLLGCSNNLDLAVKYINLALGTADVAAHHFTNAVRKVRIENKKLVEYTGPSLLFSGKGELLEISITWSKLTVNLENIGKIKTLVYMYVVLLFPLWLESVESCVSFGTLESGLYKNQLSGTIPAELGKLSQLQFL